MKKFNLRFQLKEISKWAEKYDTRQNGNQNLREKERQVKIIGNVNKRKHLTKSEFLNLCQWKSPRIVHHCEKNTEDFIHTVTKAAFESANEHFRIEVLTLLKGL